MFQRGTCCGSHFQELATALPCLGAHGVLSLIMARMSNTVCRSPRRELVGLLTIALACAAVMGGLSLKGAVSAELQERAGRDAVWRALFARPAPTPPPQPEIAARIALGHDLFRDGRLSGSGKASCATCHEPDRAFTDGRPKGRGPDGKANLARNVPALYDLAWGAAYNWDGRAPTLAAQARMPILAEEEMAGDFPTIVGRLAANAPFAARFAVAFPDEARVTEESVVAALAAYVGSLASPENRFDRWIAGDDTALSPGERLGFDIFVGKGGCVSCHRGWRFTDDGFHDIGLAGDDLGRDGRRQFKTPSLREVGHTAPYMHDGSLATLEDVVNHYAGGLIDRPSVAPTVVRALVLSDEEKAALVAFLQALTSEQADEGRHVREIGRPAGGKQPGESASLPK